MPVLVAGIHGSAALLHQAWTTGTSPVVTLFGAGESEPNSKWHERMDACRHFPDAP